MAYIQLEHANITTIDNAAGDDPIAVVLNLYGDDVLTMLTGLDTKRWPATVVGRLTEIRDELWFALEPEYISKHPEVVMRAARASDLTFRAAGWDI